MLSLRPKRKKVQSEGTAEYAQPDTAPLTHEKVVAMLEGEGRGKALDVGSGQGAMAESLKELGYEVYACDLENTLRVDGVSWARWDLNSDQVPYEPGTFDCVTCIEVIEHIENPHRLLRSIGSILKEGGTLILTTPNILHIQSRIQFLLFGSFIVFSPGDDEHINPLPLWEIERILRITGFEIEVVTNNRYTKLGYFLSLALYPILRPRIRPLLGGASLILKARLRK